MNLYDLGYRRGLGDGMVFTLAVQAIVAILVLTGYVLGHGA